MPAKDAEEYQWVHLDDFTPGLYDNSFISTADPKLSAPLGAGDAQASFCCAALAPNLGLGPLPALTTTGTFAGSMPGSSTKAFLTGFAVNPGLNNVHDELILIFEADDGSTHYLQAFSDDVQGASVHSILSTTGTTQPGVFGSPYPTWTRMNATGTGMPSPGLVFPASILDASSPQGHLYLYPEILSPTSFAVQDLIVGGSSVTGQVVCYDSRVICLVGVNYSWPAGSGINTNENINFTDPPLSSTYGNQGTILGAEEPWGYGAFGTISVGELMLIKKYGGGLIVYGDIEAPSSVVSMPGVQPVGDFVGKAAATSVGLVYCSEKMGAWIWNGNNTATKISPQLRDTFYDAYSASGILSNNYGFCVGTWQNWVLFSNNFMYNPDTGSWWVIYPGDGNGTASVTGHTMWWWEGGRFGNQMYAAPLQFGTAGGLNKNWWYRFDNTVPAPHWQWQSLPIHVTKDANRVLDVRQVAARFSDPSNSGHATATITVNGTALTTITAIPLQPTSYRFDVGVKGIQDIIIKVNGDNAVSGSSPILHSLDVGYQERAEIKVSN